jgi:cyclohexanone monooxygenase
MGGDAGERSYDAVIVGAGFSGLYMLHRLRGLGLTARLYEAGTGVGGTWYWNRYPGRARDIESLEYSYSFSPELDDEWTWSERYATQPELLAYLNHVAERFDLKRDIQFETRVTAARFDEAANRWTVSTDKGEVVSAATASWPRASCRSPMRSPSKAPTASRARPTGPATGPRKASTSPAGAWR